MPRGYRTFLCSTQLSIKFQRLIKAKMLKNTFLAAKLLVGVFILLINVKMPTIVGILTFMSGVLLCSFVLSMNKVV